MATASNRFCQDISRNIQGVRVPYLEANPIGIL
jgi:hypothetical protein